VMPFMAVIMVTNDLNGLNIIIVLQFAIRLMEQILTPRLR